MHVKVLQSLQESFITDSSIGSTVCNKCLKTLRHSKLLMQKSLSSIKANIQDLTLFPDYKMRLNIGRHS